MSRQLKKGIPNINRNVNTQYTSTHVKEISYKQALLRTQEGFDCWKYTAGKNQANLAFPASKGLLRVRYSKEINKKKFEYFVGDESIEERQCDSCVESKG